ELRLVSGDSLPAVQNSYTTQRHLTPQKDKVIWILHALTGDANGHEWWNGLVGDDKFYEPTKHFIVCANLLGSCYGSTQPLSENPKTGKPYYYDFPNLTTRDMAKGLESLRKHLGIEKIDT